MSRYIEADKLHEEDLEQSIGNLLKSVADLVRLKEIPGDTPIEDVASVVRCKDCKHLMFSDMYGECSQAHMGIVRPDDFCSCGERKDKE